jgi:hypothetical protein
MNLADKYGELILDDFAYQFEVVSNSCKGPYLFPGIGLTSTCHSLALVRLITTKREVFGIMSELMKLIRTAEKLRPAENDYPNPNYLRRARM